MYSSPRAAAILWQGTIVQTLTTPTIGLNRKYTPNRKFVQVLPCKLTGIERK
jgi:hypothetical protein